MEQRVRIGVNTVRQGKEKVIKEFDANFEQQRTLIARLIALQDRLLTSRKTLSTELGTLRESLAFPTAPPPPLPRRWGLAG